MDLFGTGFRTLSSHEARRALAMTSPTAIPSTTTLQLRDRGVVTLPKALRERYGLEPGSSLHLVDLGGVFAITPIVPRVPALIAELSEILVSEGTTQVELSSGLAEERERYTREHYGGPSESRQAK